MKIEIPMVKFIIHSGPEGLTASVNPEGPIRGIDVIGLFGTGIYAMSVSIAQQFNMSVEDVWGMLKTTVYLVEEQSPDLDIKGNEDEIRHE